MMFNLCVVFQTYGQYWLEEEGCECGPFIIEPISNDTSNPDITFREIKLTYEPQVDTFAEFVFILPSVNFAL